MKKYFSCLCSLLPHNVKASISSTKKPSSRVLVEGVAIQKARENGLLRFARNDEAGHILSLLMKFSCFQSPRESTAYQRYFLLILSFLLTSPLLAKNFTNQELVKACKDKAPGPQNFCYGFIIATANAAQFYRNLVDSQDEYIDICFPKDISNRDIVNGYITWVEKNPALLERPAFIGVSVSFSTKYSCPSKKEKEKEKEIE